MRVLIFSQYYYPEPIPKPHELAEKLADDGHEVCVLTGYPHYPTGNLAPGYKLGLKMREKIRNIPVLRLFEMPYHNAKPVQRMLNYLSFMITAPLGAFLTPKVDVMYVWHPPLTIGLAALVISKIKRVPFVYDVQDIWGHFTVLSGMVKEGSLTIKMIRRLERFVSRNADHLIVQTEAGRAYFVERGVKEERISILPHWIDEQMFAEAGNIERDRLRQEMNWQDQFIVLFAGNLGTVQGLESVVEAAKRMPNGKARIVFVGDGTDKPRLERIARDLQVGDKLQFVDRQPIERMPAFMAAADALLINLKKSEFTKFVIPSKTVAYLASGKPILMSAGGASEDLIREARAGLTVEPDDSEMLAQAIDEMCQMPKDELNKLGTNGRDFLLKYLSKNKVIADYEKLIKTVAEDYRQKRAK
jgi:glycosyltransferase involved in cell wall biosynthesis